ncbi:hypothetical protein PsW64_01615 [Pseudovibrio sp. W64]|uniref:hypothetical protein n=1 Tax=unclassified Pseudovibrio TaxID=2627060 RepID=UPI0007099003|nr:MULTISPECIES: hypothetical protein [unclassified Pseudovibrio]KZK84834.1 hypothetical protein PsW64_01615 [Pseudovibrio sp. W64]KZK86958.1 hypothetical protein PsAD13_00225 [Pseudovibrio sp. Ad13]KZK93693.1 hypothetical protein PsW74_05046 [Pseudovibrio sp. W74]KZK96104.1 hypothetical protein PsAD46_00182 [Pseudovibrio sp. Ad46]KZL12016.1 hypothetical protein PsAD14_00182 [Pseudovibrio sp. Ad14]
MDHEMMMEGFALWQVVIMIVWILVVVIPIARILNRLGFSRIWTILAFIPLVNLIFLWILAYVHWPVEDRM